MEASNDMERWAATLEMKLPTRPKPFEEVEPQTVASHQESLLPYQRLRRYATETPAVESGYASWVNMPEIPAEAELLPEKGDDPTKTEVETPVNIIDGPWEGKEAYLSTHYELLREDAVATLRDGVAQFRANPGMKDTGDLCIYDKAYITGFTLSSQGPAARVQFSMARAGKRIRWEQSKRLVPGTLLALTKAEDRFQTQCVVAIVAARPLDGVRSNPPVVDLFFARTEEVEIDPQQSWVIVESRTGYYEAYRHTLLGLQKLMPGRLPLEQHLLHLKTTVDNPETIKRNPFADMSDIVRDLPDGVSSENVHLLKEFPKGPVPDLDQSQLSALERMLTKELAIIQGPPGTGKTHVSLMALKVLLRHMGPNDPPIIVASHTNHALDQLLRYVAEFEPEFIRLGGRSADQGIIKARTMHEVRRGKKPPSVHGNMLNHAHSRLKELVDRQQSLLDILQHEKGPLSPSILFQMSLITEQQYRMFNRGIDRWINVDSRAHDSMARWLGEELMWVDMEGQAEELGFEYEDADLEFEQLKEIEAEFAGPNEEDKDDALSGKWVPYKIAFTARTQPHITEAQVKRALKETDLWMLPMDMRAAAYRYWLSRVKAILRTSFRKDCKEYMNLVRQIKYAKWEIDSEIMRKVKIVGVTTTGLGKYRPLIESLQPRVLLIEEAAETFEGMVLAGCVESLEHLILVGDHKQLRGSCAVQELEGEPYNLAISMFERLLTNGIEHTTLTRQRRMIPEIRRILNGIYEELEDHPCVLEREPVPGMGGVNSFWFSHDWPELRDHVFSRCNELEARMLVGFFVYLVYNGMPSASITILTFYNGQRKAILKALRNERSLQGMFFNVKTVDSYQGEENEVVLLSLVRSNSKENIGFLATENRVCVALSRAQRGFYIFGNGDMLSKTPIWYQVLSAMNAAPKRIDYALPVTCSTHGTTEKIKEPGDWQWINGGCRKKCDQKLPCGHPCVWKCHSFSHERLQCNEPCKERLPCGHICKLACSDDKCICLCPAGARKPFYKKGPPGSSGGPGRGLGAPNQLYGGPIVRPAVKQTTSAQYGTQNRNQATQDKIQDQLKAIHDKAKTLTNGAVNPPPLVVLSEEVTTAPLMSRASSGSAHEVAKLPAKVVPTSWTEEPNGKSSLVLRDVKISPPINGLSNGYHGKVPSSLITGPGILTNELLDQFEPPPTRTKTRKSPPAQNATVYHVPTSPTHRQVFPAGVISPPKKAWRDFANGGHEKHDQELRSKAQEQNMERDMMESLFTETIKTPSLIPTKIDMPLIDLSPDPVEPPVAVQTPLAKQAAPLPVARQISTQVVVETDKNGRAVRVKQNDLYQPAGTNGVVGSKAAAADESFQNSFGGSLLD